MKKKIPTAILVSTLDNHNIAVINLPETETLNGSKAFVRDIILTKLKRVMGEETGTDEEEITFSKFNDSKSSEHKFIATVNLEIEGELHSEVTLEETWIYR